MINIIFLSLVIKKSSWGIINLALGISLSHFLRTLLFLAVLRKKLSFTITPFDRREITKITAAAMGSAFTAWSLMTLLDRFVFDTRYVFPLIILTITAAGGGLVVFLLLSFLFNTFTAHQFLTLIKKKIFH